MPKFNPKPGDVIGLPLLQAHRNETHKLLVLDKQPDYYRFYVIYNAYYVFGDSPSMIILSRMYVERNGIMISKCDKEREYEF